VGRKVGKITKVYVYDEREDRYCELMDWSQDEDLPSYDDTLFTIRDVMTGVERSVSAEYLETYLRAASEMEVLAWAAR
jgi:hypothetical protein